MRYPINFATSVALLTFSSQILADDKPWSGVANVNLNIAQSQQDSQSFFFSATAATRYKAGNKIEVNGLYLYAKQTQGTPKQFVVNEDRWGFGGRYETPAKDGRFAFVDQRFERNGIVNLNLRTLTSAGLGQYVFRSEGFKKSGKIAERGDASWQITAGLSFLTEAYANNLGSKEELGLNLGSNYDRVLNSGVSISHRFFIIPSIRDASDYYFLSQLNFGIPVAGRASLALSIINDYDTTPAEGSRKDNTKYALTLGYRF